MALRKLLLIALLFPILGTAQPMYKLIRKKASSCALLLDSYSGPKLAYSVRKLDCDYSGSAIRVRRSSDDAEQDIGFSGNDLDQSALLSFVGEGVGDDGFIVTWYDQSGNGINATQSTGSKQPMIVDEGVILTQGGIPSARFDGTDDYLTVSSLALNCYTSLYIVLRAVNASKPMFTEHGPDAANNEGFYFYGSNGDSWTFNRAQTGGDLHRASGVSNWVSSATGSDLALADVQYNGSGAFYLDNSAQANNTVNGTSNPNTSATKNLFIFSRNGASLFTEGYLSEYILYDSDQTGNRSNIVSNINTYYTIY
jgi:hypothetical protein